MSARRWTLVGLAAVVLVTSAWCALLALAVAHGDPSPVESGLAQAGYNVERGAATALAGLDDDAPEAVVLRGPPQLSSAEQAALQDYVRAGGDLWVFSDEPQLALWPSLRGQVGTYPGYIYSEDGREPVLLAGSERKAVTIDGAKALRLEGVEATGVVTADAHAFRDSDGDGKLETGEPSGPFVVGALLREGEGRVILVAIRPGSEAGLPLGELAPGKAGRAVVVDSTTGGWTLPPRAILTALALPSASLLGAACAVALTAALILMAFGEASAARDRSADAAKETLDQLSQRLRARDPAHPFLRLLEETPRD